MVLRPVTALSPDTRRVWCHIRWPECNHAEREVVTFDVTIADERGRVVAEIQEFTLRRGRCHRAH